MLNLHWRQSLFGDGELLGPATPTATPTATSKVSSMTLAALADLGYEVDYTAAVSFTLS